jgi:hypothetical protein
VREFSIPDSKKPQLFGQFHTLQQSTQRRRLNQAAIREVVHQADVDMVIIQSNICVGQEMDKNKRLFFIFLNQGVLVDLPAGPA